MGKKCNHLSTKVMVNTRMEARWDGLEKIVHEQANENNHCFQQLEEMFQGLPGVVEHLTSSTKHQEAQDSIAIDGHEDNGGNEGVSSVGISTTWRKLDIPVLERYFRLKGVGEKERMKAVMVALEGKALNWFQWWETCHPHPTWEAFKDVVVRRFQPTMLQNPFEVLLGLRQTEPIGEYIEQFEQYVGFMKGIQQDYLVGIFLNGLRDEIKVEVKLYDLQTLAELMMKAQIVEYKLLMGHSTYSKDGGGSATYSRVGGSFGVFPNYVPNVGESSASVSPSTTFAPISQRRAPPYKKLTQEELQDKIRKGLCFHCDEKFGPNHICRNKQFHMLIISEEELPTWGDGLETLVVPTELPETDGPNLQGLGSCREPLAVKMWWVWIANIATLPYMVEVGDGHKVRCQGKLEWLAPIGEVRADFGNLKLSIGKGPLEHVLQGDPTLSKSKSNLKTLWYNFKQKEVCYVLKWTEIKEPGANPVPPAILDVLSAHQDVFTDLEGLPPRRSFDHSIHLQPNASIPNLRPYKYSHQQKNEIEILVQEMLQGRVIRPSISSYSSPIILVKKKDGGWHFCVDYWALNKVTIPNKFPIPIIEELLDELVGATMFSKLDLKSGYHQIRMRPQDIEKTAFGTHEGHYEFFSTLDAHVQHLAKGVATDPKKVEVIQNWPLPKTPKALRGFLGLMGYYRRFVQGYGKIVKPLTQLLSKDGFHWIEEARAAFEELKVIAHLPVLAVPDFSKSLTLETDASGKALSSRAQNKSVYERELMTLVQAFKWASKLIGFDFEIRFRPGKDNPFYNPPNGTNGRRNPKQMQANWWYLEGLPTYLKDMHESPTGGHSGYYPTFKRIVGVIYWKGMKKDIKEWVQQCTVCQRNKAETLAPIGLLQPLPILTQVWSDISMDFIGAA
ncbi:hypothetical protein V8G54_034916 [Vigna mungo]|uniref:Uncharacterized protein n=1 Tax=Vigna mungo TaxID=3915 RepID=A0AAQ3ME70_VIGMU